MLKRVLPVAVTFLASVILLVNGCAEFNHGLDKGKADATEERSHNMIKEASHELVGSWKLVSFYSQDASGKVSYPFGKNASGRIIYEPSGRMAVQLMNHDRRKFSSGDVLVSSETELREAFGGYTAYYGTYSVNLKEKTIVHYIEVAIFPNWIGTNQLRHFEYDGKYLTLKGPLLLGGVQGAVNLVWERLP